MPALAARPPLPAKQPGLDRFLGFAFAAADLLVELGEHGVITWAGGAFASRLGAPPEHFLNRRLADLIAPADHPALAMALSAAALRGRAPPSVLRLADPGQTPIAFAALALPGAGPRLCATLGPLPVARAAAPFGLQDRVVFAREAEARLRSGQGGGVGLLEITGLATAGAALTDEQLRVLMGEIGQAMLDGGGPGAVAGTIGDGRFGVLAGDAGELAAVATQIGALLHDRAVDASLAAVALPLGATGLTGPQAARALRFALARFAEGGTSELRREGFADGLAGFIASAEARARAMRETIGARRFRLAFQPVVDLEGRRIEHFEALLRPIPTPGSPLRGTQDFVTFAEAVGLSEELDTAVLIEAVAALAAAPAARVAVNVSGLSMQSPSFRDRLADLILPGVRGRLLIELTETAEIEDVPGAVDTLDRLRALGVPVCIDDFGAGAAAFRYLRDFRVDFVKIDGAYVRGAARNARERGFVASMLDLAASVGAEVIAEMIETEEEARLMHTLGVQYGQGWLFGRPGSLPGAK